MADLGGEFNANDVAPSTGFKPVPIGWVLAMIVDSKSKKTDEAGNETEDLARVLKHRVSLTYQILDERKEYQTAAGEGRKIFHGLNLKNPEPTTVQIARGNLSAICRATGVLTPKDSSELHNLPHMIRIGQRKNKQTGELENVINDWKPKDGAPAASAASAASSSSVPAAPAGSVPWATPKSA